MAEAVRCEQVGVNDERYGAAQSDGNSAVIGGCLAAKRGWHNSVAARYGSKHRYQHVGGRPGIDELLRSCSQPSPDAQTATLMAGRRTVKVGVTGVCEQRCAAGVCSRFAIRAGALCNDVGGDRGWARLSDSICCIQRGFRNSLLIPVVTARGSAAGGMRGRNQGLDNARWQSGCNSEDKLTGNICRMRKTRFIWRYERGWR